MLEAACAPVFHRPFTPLSPSHSSAKLSIPSPLHHPQHSTVKPTSTTIPHSPPQESVSFRVAPAPQSKQRQQPRPHRESYMHVPHGRCPHPKVPNPRSNPEKRQNPIPAPRRTANRTRHTRQRSHGRFSPAQLFCRLYRSPSPNKSAAQSHL